MGFGQIELVGRANSIAVFGASDRTYRNPFVLQAHRLGLITSLGSIIPAE
jgi:hypothetical protein